jgi:hypothetical protein
MTASEYVCNHTGLINVSTLATSEQLYTNTKAACDCTHFKKAFRKDLLSNPDKS